eukprot:5786460-Pleurochrysis_carterae.AAC.1
MGLVGIFRSGVTSSSASHSLGVLSLELHFFLLSASPPSFVSRPIPPIAVSDSILAVIFLCSLVYSTFLPTPPPPYAAAATPKACSCVSIPPSDPA